MAMYETIPEEVPVRMTRPHIAACQFEPTVGDVEANLEYIRKTAHGLPAPVTFAVFPELCVTGYDLDIVPSTNISVPGPVTDSLAGIARDTHTDLVVGLPEAAGEDSEDIEGAEDIGGAYNSLVYVSSAGVAGTYRKRRLWGNEAEQFSAGTTPLTIDTPAGRTGFLLCYDLNFPELALEYAKNECDLIVVSAAWRQSFERDWRLLCRARALDQGCYVVASNHGGSQSGRQHAGESLIASPNGDIVAKTSDGSPTASSGVSREALEIARRRNPVRTTRRDERRPKSRR